MKKNLVLLTVVYVIIGCFACNSEKQPVSVFLDTAFINEHRVLLNDTTLLKTNAEEDFVELLIPAGENTITIDGVKESFTAKKSEGILNVAKESFYLYPIEYGQSFGTSYTTPVVFDSMVIYDKRLTENQDDLLKLLQDSNKKRLFSGKSKKIGSEELYIEKRWDLGFLEEIPEQLETTSSKVVLDKIIKGNYFVLAASLSDEFNVEKIENGELMKLIDGLHTKK